MVAVCRVGPPGGPVISFAVMSRKGITTNAAGNSKASVPAASATQSIVAPAERRECLPLSFPDPSLIVFIRRSSETLAASSARALPASDVLAGEMLSGGEHADLDQNEGCRRLARSAAAGYRHICAG